MTPACRMEAHRPRRVAGRAVANSRGGRVGETGGEQRNRRDQKSPAGRGSRATYFKFGRHGQAPRFPNLSKDQWPGPEGSVAMMRYMRLSLLAKFAQGPQLGTSLSPFARMKAWI